MIRARAEKLSAVRSFFAKRGVIEVDCPALSPFSAIDEHIDPITTLDGEYLFTSPEYGMKRLLADGSGDIYQLSHVFRKEIETPLHTSEFMMIEWYRVATTFDAFIEECIEMIELFIEKRPIEKITYQQALIKHAGIDYTAVSHEELYTRAQQLASISGSIDAWDRDTLLGVILTQCVEPKFSPKAITVLTDYPASQAALAKTEMRGGVEVAMRFEFYVNGIELGNGYHELTDASIQKNRLEEAEHKRRAMGKDALVIDTHFLAALEKGLPDCYGVAMGFDRLMMLSQNKDSIRDIHPLTKST